MSKKNSITSHPEKNKISKWIKANKNKIIAIVTIFVLLIIVGSVFGYKAHIANKNTNAFSNHANATIEKDNKKTTKVPNETETTNSSVSTTAATKSKKRSQLMKPILKKICC